MGNRYQNQHFVSRTLLERFCDESNHLQKYLVRLNKWKRTGVRDTFAHRGYTQMLADKEIDNSVEIVFGKVEKDLPTTLAALDEAATRPVTELSKEVYENMCWYCAFLHHLSPFSKAKAPFDFLDNLNTQLLAGKGDLLDEYLLMPVNEIESHQSEIRKGEKIVFEADNYLQLIHRVQLKRFCKHTAADFRRLAKWTVSISPINLPISDIALIEIATKENILYGMPISPSLLLMGAIPRGITINITEQNKVFGAPIPLNMAQQWVDVICLSAQDSLASKTVVPDVLERRERAIKNGHGFTNVKSLHEVIASGTKSFRGDFRFKAVSQNEYDSFVKTYLQ